MLVPLIVLAVLSLVGGWLFPIPKILEEMFPAAEEGHNLMLVGISVAAGVIGILLAWVMYVAKPGLADSMGGGLYKLLYNKYFVDEIYDATVVKPMVSGSRGLLWKGVDAGLIDGIVNGVGGFARGVGGVLRLLQSGNTRSYATWVLFGSVIVIVVLGIAGGIR
jgi:NADH-quinone oxidoreductase subunit L